MTQAVALAQQASTGVSQGFKNRIINGAMVIAQRGTSFTPGTSAGAFTLDRWEYNSFAGAGAYSVAQSTTVPNGNFTYSTQLTVTATATPSGSNYVFYQTKIEGFNMADFGWGTANAQTVTVSFWARSSVTGTYSFHLINESINLSYVATFSISAANTWQFVTLTIPGPTTGTWNTTNGVGIYAGIDLGMGSSRQTTANTWSSGASFFCGTSSNVQWISNSGATFFLTGVQLEVGSSATSFEYRAYNVEFDMCRRYYEQFVVGTGSPNNIILSGVLTGSNCTASVYFKTTKRATPSWALLSGTSWTNTPNNSMTSTDVAVFQNTTSGFFFLGGGTGQGIAFSAEL